MRVVVQNIYGGDKTEFVGAEAEITAALLKQYEGIVRHVLHHIQEPHQLDDVIHLIDRCQAYMVHTFDA